MTKAYEPATLAGHGDLRGLGRLLGSGDRSVPRRWARRAVGPADASMGDGVSGRGRGEVSLDAAFPEPYIGALDHRPVGVFLGLNPGQAQLDFQGRSGLFADEIRYRGTYSAWAATCHTNETRGSQGWAPIVTSGHAWRSCGPGPSSRS
jgi:hypothetical protein